ncbi:MAG: phasin family protein [Xenococcaceae cyanobacterium]
MAGFDDLVKKAFYMGVGFASYAQEKAGVTLNELKTQAQKLADEMIERGELSTEEARKFVDELVQQAQQENVPSAKNDARPSEPRRIEILSDDDEPMEQQKKTEQKNIDNLKEQVQSLQEELRRLKRE